MRLPCVLVLDQDPAVRRLVKTTLAGQGYFAIAAADSSVIPFCTALGWHPDVVISRQAPADSGDSGWTVSPDPPIACGPDPEWKVGTPVPIPN